MRIVKLFVFMIFNGALSYFSIAFGYTPEGSWRTYDLDHNPRSIVKFSEQNGIMRGTITKVLSPRNPQARCDACQGKWHNIPLVGLPIVWGLKKAGNQWIHGYVLNVDNGKIYRCNVRVSEDNRTLYFTAYVGTPFFGKTLNWVRTQ